MSPKLLVIAGPNGSGKSSIVNETDISEEYGEKLINPDNYARALEKFIPDLRKRYVFAMNACDEMREILLKNGVDFGFETVLSTDSKLDFIKKAKDCGYTVDFLFVTLFSTDLCCQRVKNRVSRGGHDVEEGKIRSRYEKSMNNLHKALELADSAEVYDNSGVGPLLVFHKNSTHSFLITEKSRPEWVNNYPVRYLDGENLGSLHTP